MYTNIGPNRRFSSALLDFIGTLFEFIDTLFNFIDILRRIVCSGWLWGLGWLFHSLSGSHRNWLCEEFKDQTRPGITNFEQ
jgi:hypothetical protein